MNELERIQRLAQRFRQGGQGGQGIDLGIGDDAAVLVPQAGRKLVWTIDEQIEHTHFRRDLVGWADEGWRSFMAAASDLSAMGAEPWCALSALSFPRELDDSAIEELTEGQRLASEAVGAPIVGGNLARAREVSITTTLLGSAERPVERKGARPGDSLWIAGSLGLARAGLLALEQKSTDARLRRAIAAWQRPRALIAEGLAMAQVAHAAIDVSDGLAQDALHVARAGEVCLVLDEAQLLAHGGPALALAAQALGKAAIDLVLEGGEDYALLAASEVAPAGFAPIGRVRVGAGVVLATASGERVLEAHGFDHFRT